MYNEGGDPGACGLHRRRAFWTFFITALGLGVVFLDISIVNVALQSISGGFNIGVTDLEWIVDAYTLAFAGLLLTAGAIGDRLGNKGIFLLGILIFAISSLLCGLAPSLNPDHWTRFARCWGRPDHTEFVDAAEPCV